MKLVLPQGNSDQKRYKIVSYRNLAREYLFPFEELYNYTDISIIIIGFSYYIKLFEIRSFFRGEEMRSVLNIQLKEVVIEPVTHTSLM